MSKFIITDAFGRVSKVGASTIDAATCKIERTGKRNLFGIEGGGKARFFLDRGAGVLWQISARTAANELAMGGFEK